MAQTRGFLRTQALALVAALPRSDEISKRVPFETRSYIFNQSVFSLPTTPPTLTTHPIYSIYPCTFSTAPNTSASISVRLSLVLIKTSCEDFPLRAMSLKPYTAPAAPNLSSNLSALPPVFASLPGVIVSVSGNLDASAFNTGSKPGAKLEWLRTNRAANKTGDGRIPSDENNYFGTDSVWQSYFFSSLQTVRPTFLSFCGLFACVANAATWSRFGFARVTYFENDVSPLFVYAFSIHHPTRLPLRAAPVTPRPTPWLPSPPPPISSASPSSRPPRPTPWSSSPAPKPSQRRAGTTQALRKPTL